MIGNHEAWYQLKPPFKTKNSQLNLEIGKSQKVVHVLMVDRSISVKKKKMLELNWQFVMRIQGIQ